MVYLRMDSNVFEILMHSLLQTIRWWLPWTRPMPGHVLTPVSNGTLVLNGDGNLTHHIHAKNEWLLLFLNEDELNENVIRVMELETGRVLYVVKHDFKRSFVI